MWALVHWNIKDSFLALSVFLVLTSGWYIYRWIYPNPKYGVLNISCFAFRDNNRNGHYDMADRPYAGLLIQMERPQMGTVLSHSNLSGFTNFKMMLGNNKVDVSSPGLYFIHAKPPIGWKISSSNASQKLKFRKLDGSPTGIVADHTCAPIGVVPELSISGKIALGEFGGLQSIQSFTASNPIGGVVEIKFKDDGSFNFPVTEGEWKLNLISNNQIVSRIVTVADTAVVISSLKPTAARNEKAKNTYHVGFDDLTLSDTLYEVPNGYGQLKWTNWIATHHKFYEGYGYINATISSEYIAYNSSGHPAEIWAKQPFDFSGVYISVAWPEAESGDVIIRAWRGDELVYEDRFKASTAGAIYFDSDYRNINKLVFSTEKFWQLVIDEFLYRMNR